MKIVVLMDGDGSCFGDKVYKPFVEVNGKTILEWSLSSLPENELKNHEIHFAIRESHDEKFDVTYRLRTLFKGKFHYYVYYLDGLTRGNLETAYIVNEGFNGEEEILFLDFDNYYNGQHLFRFIHNKKKKYSQFGLTCCFEPVDDFNKWCFVTLNGKQEATGIFEKDKNALENGGKPMVGVFYFSNRVLFNDMAETVFKKESKTNNEFYMSEALKEMVFKQIPVFVYKTDKIVPLGTPGDVEIFKNGMLNE